MSWANLYLIVVPFTLIVISELEIVTLPFTIEQILFFFYVILLLGSALKIVICHLLGRPDPCNCVESMSTGTIVFSARKTQLKLPVTECSICWEEFIDGDVVRVLSACNHGFHKQCIDKWLIRNDRCPYGCCTRYQKSSWQKEIELYALNG
ncbi:RING-H2 finger protein ATL40-like [Zingiber officinale]|nr:RING-H2 finger protein ATL40-like [Zingiber officinale]